MKPATVRKPQPFETLDDVERALWPHVFMATSALGEVAEHLLHLRRIVARLAPKPPKAKRKPNVRKRKQSNPAVSDRASEC